MNDSNCEKVPYDTHLQAMKASVTHRRKGRHKYGAYKCDRCGKFHLTTITKNLKPEKKKYPFRYQANNGVPTPVMKKSKHGRKKT